MTRKSKIARLPRSARDELNRRLDNGHSGVRLVEWLNGLPEVKEVLARDFQGRPITSQNLSEWKRGGYHDWVAQQECSANLKDWLADAKELGEAASLDQLANAMFTFATVHYAAAMYDSIIRPESCEKLRLWSPILNDVIRLRNSDLARERFELDIQKLAFNEEKLEVQTELARQRLELDRARLELARQKASEHLQEIPGRSADIPVRNNVNGQKAQSFPHVGSTSDRTAAVLSRSNVNGQQVPSFSNAGAASLSPTGWGRAEVRARVPGEISLDVGCSHIQIADMGSKTPLEINALQPNPTKSNNPFFIFSQTLTVGQASCLSPSSFPRLPVKIRPHAQNFPQTLISEITQHPL